MFGVNIWLAIQRLLAAFAVFGLVLAPLTTLAMTSAVPADMAMADDDMPCCQPERPVASDCQSACPLMMLCVAKLFPDVAHASGQPIRPSVAQALFLADDDRADTLPLAPPAPPPRT
jgi:hypothetical protein